MELGLEWEYWYWTHKVIERLFHFVWLHPGWTIFFIIMIFHHGSHVYKHKKEEN